MSDLAAYLAAAVLLGFAVYRFATDRRLSPYPTQRYVYGFVLAEGLSLAMLAPASTTALTSLTTSGLTVEVLADAIRTAAVSFLMLIAFSLARFGDPRVPARIPLALGSAVAVQAIMIGTFYAAGPQMTPDGSILVPGAGRWLLAVHDAAFAAYAIWSLVALVKALARHARSVAPGPLRIGLRITLAAALVGIIWALWTADDVADVLASGFQDGSEDIPSNVLGAVCAVLVVTAATVARWGDALAAAVRWLRAWSTYLRLAPLWNALHAELPQIALNERRARIRSGGQFALYRRVIEIHDGRLALRPYAYPRAEITQALDAAGTDAHPTPALLEAVSIAAALENLRSGRRLHNPSATEPATSDPASAALPTALASEAAWLLDVTRAFSTSPLVPRAVARLHAPDPH